MTCNALWRSVKPFVLAAVLGEVFLCNDGAHSIPFLFIATTHGSQRHIVTHFSSPHIADFIVSEISAKNEKPAL